MDKKTIIADFYTKESAQYSRKRYEGELNTYTQYLFRRRMNIYFDFLRYIKSNVNKKISLFDIGCADGVVLFNTENMFSSMISSYTAVDISSGMVDVANNKKPNDKFSFYLRGKEPSSNYDLVTELGVHVPDLRSEINYIKQKLNLKNSFFIFSSSSGGSLHTYFKIRNNPETSHIGELKRYKEIENILKTEFKIIKSVPYGLFIPKLWASSNIGKALQPIIDKVFSYIVPGLFHEKIYLLTPINKES
jgi:SAM-dependent methyltransferase